MGIFSNMDNKKGYCVFCGKELSDGKCTACGREAKEVVSLSSLNWQKVPRSTCKMRCSGRRPRGAEKTAVRESFVHRKGNDHKRGSFYRRYSF